MPSPRSRRGVGLRAAEQNAGVFADFAQPGAFSNAARGAVAGLLGLPGDVSQMVEAGVNQLPVAAQVPIRGLLGSGAIEGAELPTSERVAGLLGADLSRPSTQAGLIGAPDPRDVGRVAFPFMPRAFKGMQATDDAGNAITKIQRQSAFPTFGGEVDEIEGIAGFFSSDPKVADRFAELYSPPGGQGASVFPVKLDFERPKIIDAGGRPAGDVQFGKSGKEFQDAVMSGEYDGVIIRNTKDEGDVFVSLNPDNIRMLGDL